MILNKISYLIDGAGLIACSIGFMSILGRTIDLLTYTEFKHGVILAVGLGFTAYALNKLSSVVCKGK